MHSPDGEKRGGADAAIFLALLVMQGVRLWQNMQGIGHNTEVVSRGENQKMKFISFPQAIQGHEYFQAVGIYSLLA